MSKPNPSAPKMSTPWNSTPLDTSAALAEVAASQSSATAATLNAREPTDLLKALAASPADFKAKVGAAKWSDRVEALKFFIESAGPEPFKIAKGEYAPLIGTLKQVHHNNRPVVEIPPPPP